MSSCSAHVRPHAAPLPRRPYASSAFSLIELLVVVAIIMVLAGLLISAVSRARAESQFSACAANLKQYGTAHEMRSSDFDETVVAMFSTTQNHNFLLQLDSYIESNYQETDWSTVSNNSATVPDPPETSIHTCPSEQHVQGVNNDLEKFYPEANGAKGYQVMAGSQDARFRFTTYGLNRYIGTDPANPISGFTDDAGGVDTNKLGSFLHPADTWVFGDAYPTSPDTPYIWPAMPDSDDTAAVNFERHRRKANFVHLDGHVAPVRITDQGAIASTSDSPYSENNVRYLKHWSYSFWDEGVRVNIVKTQLLGLDDW